MGIMRKRAILVVDAGTTAIKAALVEDSGHVLASAEVAQPVLRPKPGHVEQAPDDWWKAFAGAVRGCQVDDAPPRALAITGQMQDLVLLDEKGAPVRNALLYSDHRAGAELAALNTELGNAWHHAIGNVPDPSSTAAQLRWVAAHEPDALRRAHRILLGAPGYLAHRAGGEPSCDLTTASTTGLLDIVSGTWWGPVLNALGLDGARLPRLVTGTRSVGELSRGAAAELGLSSGLPLVHAAGDAGAVTAGLIGDSLGALSISLGTSGWVAALTGHLPALHGSIHHLIGPTGQGSLLIGALLSAGATVDWARQTYLPNVDHAAADEMAAAVGPTDLLMLPSLSGERSPIRNPAAVGAVIGIRPTTTAAQLYRAAMEGVAYSLEQVLAQLKPGAGHSSDRANPIPLSGGGARSRVFQQIIADVLARPMLPVAAEHAGLLGAHRAAAAALGESLPRALMDSTAPSGMVHPGPAQEHYARLSVVHSNLWQALESTFSALHTQSHH